MKKKYLVFSLLGIALLAASCNKQTSQNSSKPNATQSSDQSQGMMDNSAPTSSGNSMMQESASSTDSMMDNSTSSDQMMDHGSMMMQGSSTGSMDMGSGEMMQK